MIAEGVPNGCEVIHLRALHPVRRQARLHQAHCACGLGGRGLARERLQGSPLQVKRWRHG
ncbi:hypothetical protein PSN_0984 [Pseudomonas sp. NGC7]